MAERATVARPYARAAFAHAKDNARLGEWSTWLGRASDTVLSDEYRRLQGSPGIRTGQLIDVQQFAQTSVGLIERAHLHAGPRARRRHAGQARR